MATPDTRHSIVIKKSGDYRGSQKVWSNRYHFEGALPTDSAAWTVLADNIVAEEKKIFDNFNQIVEAIGYDSSTATSTNPHGDAVFTKTYAVSGIFVAAGADTGCPGDCASLVRYSTLARSSRNHPVYLMNYYHGVYRGVSGADVLAADQKVVLETYADHWLTGFTDGTGPRERCGPHGAVAVSRRVDPFVRHRDFRN